METASALRRQRPDALTVIVPRHPQRGAEIETLAKTRGVRSVRRCSGALPSSDTEIYIADTLGELGLFYRAAPFAFLGGSLVEHGGQNPLEPARLGTAVITGPHIHNFEAIYSVLLKAQGEGLIHSPAELTQAVARLALNPDLAAELGIRAKQAATGLSGALSATIAAAEALLASHAHA
jgi:3-deoxy-D-manno-octulosonic-acid transferase